MVDRFGKRISASALLFLFSFSLYVFTMSGMIRYGDEIEKYRVAQSIVEPQSFSFRPTAMRTAAGVGGRNYSIYELGQTILQVPLYLLGKASYSIFPVPDINWITMLFVGLLNPLLTALTCVILFKTCVALGYRYRVSLALTILFGLGTIAWPYSRGFTREPLLTLLTLLSFYAVYRFQKSQDLRWLLAAGAAAGYLTFSKFIHAMVIPFLLIYVAVVVFQAGRRAHLDRRQTTIEIAKGLGLFLAPAFLLLTLQSIYAWLRFGTFFAGIAGTKNSPLDWILYLLPQSHPATAIAGLLILPDKSIFIYSPPVVLFLVAWFKWFKSKTQEAILLLALLLIEFVAVISRPDWDGGSWWGPRYLVQVTPFLILPLGVLLESSHRAVRRLWEIVFAIFFAMGLFVQILGAFSDDREYLDITGKGIQLAGAIDFLRHGAIDSPVISLSPTGSPLQINSFGILLGAIVLGLGFAIAWRMRRSVDEHKSSSRLSWAFLTLILLIEFGGFVGWIVAPYAQVLAAKGNTRYVAASRFLADDRKCEATAMYLMALNWQTTYQQQAAERIEQLLPRAKGKLMAIDDPMHWIEAPEGTSIEDDPSVTITGDDSIRFSAPVGKDANVSISSGPIRVLPNTQYELSGWTKGEALYGTGYGVISIFEDNGNWEDGRTTDIQAMDETRGWQPFRGSITTLPTTRRLFVKAGLYKTYGTLWVDGVQLIQVDPNAPRAAVTLPPCER